MKIQLKMFCIAIILTSLICSCPNVIFCNIYDGSKPKYSSNGQPTFIEIENHLIELSRKYGIPIQILNGKIDLESQWYIDLGRFEPDKSGLPTTNSNGFGFGLSQITLFFNKNRKLNQNNVSDLMRYKLGELPNSLIKWDVTNVLKYLANNNFINNNIYIPVSEIDSSKKAGENPYDLKQVKNADMSSIYYSRNTFTIDELSNWKILADIGARHLLDKKRISRGSSDASEILENWYYPLAFYNGGNNFKWSPSSIKSNPRYMEKVFNYISGSNNYINRDMSNYVYNLIYPNENRVKLIMPGPKEVAGNGYSYVSPTFNKNANNKLDSCTFFINNTCSIKNQIYNNCYNINGYQEKINIHTDKSMKKPISLFDIRFDYSKGNLLINWKPPLSLYGNITKYAYTYRFNDDYKPIKETTRTSIKFSNIRQYKKFYLKISAFNNNGQGQFSNYEYNINSIMQNSPLEGKINPTSDPDPDPDPAILNVKIEPAGPIRMANKESHLFKAIAYDENLVDVNIDNFIWHTEPQNIGIIQSISQNSNKEVLFTAPDSFFSNFKLFAEFEGKESYVLISNKNNNDGGSDNSSCIIDTSSIPEKIQCLSRGKYSIIVDGYDQQFCSAYTSTSDPTIVAAQINNEMNSVNRLYVNLETFDKCGLVTITISITGKINCTKTIAIQTIGSCCNQPLPLELYVDPLSTTMCVGEKKQFYIKSTSGISFTDENWSSDSQCLRQVPGTQGLFEAICTGGPFQIKASVMTNTGFMEAKSATVTIVNNPSITISPSNYTLDCYQTTQFLATTNPPGIPVMWSVEPSSIGSITNNGLFTPVKNNGNISGVIIAKAGTGICIGEGRASVTINCATQTLIIEPVNPVISCQPFQFKAFLEPEHIPCNPIWQMSCQPSGIGTINSTTGWFIPIAGAKGTCTIIAIYNNLQVTISIILDCSSPPQPPQCINLWIQRPSPLMQPSNPYLSAYEICKCIPYQFKAYCTKSDNSGPYDVSSQGQWLIIPPVSGVAIDSNGKLISAVVGTFTVVFKMGDLTAQYTITVVDCYICPPIGMYVDCDLVFFVGSPFPINPILYTADGSTSQISDTKPVTYTIGNPSIIRQQGNEFVGLKAGRTTVDVYYENLHTKTLVVINPPPNDNCSSGSIIAPPNSQVRLDPMLRPVPSYWYYKCCPIVFRSLFKDISGQPIDCSVSRWDAIALDPSNDGTFIMNNGLFVANRSGWFIIIVNCCDLTIVICIYIVDEFCPPSVQPQPPSNPTPPSPPPCEKGITLSKTMISKDFSDTCCPDANPNNDIPRERFEESVTATKENDEECVIWSNAQWLYTEPVRFTERTKIIKIYIDPEYFAKGTGCVGMLTFKTKNCGEAVLNVFLRTKGINLINLNAYPVKQDWVNPRNQSLGKRNITTQQIWDQVKNNIDNPRYRFGQSCEKNIDLKTKYDIVAFQIYTPKDNESNQNIVNRSFVPLRFFADTACLNVEWDAQNKKAKIWGYGKKVTIGMDYKILIEDIGSKGCQMPSFSDDKSEPGCIQCCSKPTNPPLSEIAKGLVLNVNDRIVVAARKVFETFGAIVDFKSPDMVTIEYSPGWDYPCSLSLMPVVPNSSILDLILCSKFELKNYLLGLNQRIQDIFYIITKFRTI